VNSLPVLVNEFCTTWGNPTHERVCALARRLKGSGAKYLVIDAGWYRGENGNWDLNQGDWTPSPDYSRWIAATAKFIREQGLVPGLWFEFEVVGSQSKCSTRWLIIFSSGMEFLSWRAASVWIFGIRGYGIIYTGRSSFFCVKPALATSKWITTKRLAWRRRCRVLGEGLRQHIMGVQDFFREMRKELPDL